VVSRSVHVRHAIRQVSLKLSQNATRETFELVRWFAAEVRQSLELEYVVVVLDGAGADGKPSVTRVGVGEVSVTESGLSESVQFIHRTLTDSRRVVELGTLDNEPLEQA
jgi:hypothetical protein